MTNKENVGQRLLNTIKIAAEIAKKEITDLGASFLPAARGADTKLPSHEQRK